MEVFCLLGGGRHCEAVLRIVPDHDEGGPRAVWEDGHRGGVSHPYGVSTVPAPHTHTPPWTSPRMSCAMRSVSSRNTVSNQPAARPGQPPTANRQR